MHHDAIDRYAGGTGFLHQIDPRVKMLAILAYAAAAVSESRHEIAGLLPYLVPPLAALLVSGLPPTFLLRRLLAISPFVLVLAASLPIFEPRPVVITAGGWSATVRAGWVSAASILLKFLATAPPLLILAATTPLHRLAGALSDLGTPRILAAQVALLYRYLFLVVDEFERRRRAVEARMTGKVRWTGRARLSGILLAGLLGRSLERAERVGQAMAARGFEGRFPRIPGERLRARDAFFLAGILALAAGLRLRPLWT